MTEVSPRPAKAAERKATRSAGSAQPPEKADTAASSAADAGGGRAAAIRVCRSPSGAAGKGPGYCRAASAACLLGKRWSCENADRARQHCGEQQRHRSWSRQFCLASTKHRHTGANSRQRPHTTTTRTLHRNAPTTHSKRLALCRFVGGEILDETFYKSRSEPAIAKLATDSASCHTTFTDTTTLTQRCRCQLASGTFMQDFSLQASRAWLTQRPARIAAALERRTARGTNLNHCHAGKS